MSSPTLSCPDITDTSERALACLRAAFRTNSDGGAGWYHYLDDPNPGVTASAVGLYCFRMAEASFERADDVVSYLVSQQTSGPGRQFDGGWAVRTTNGFPIVEATAWVVRALSTPVAGAGDAVRRGASFLERNQNTDFGWGSYAGQPSRVFHTALAMLALQECGGDPAIIDNGHKWLINAQSADQPAWGAVPGDEPTLLHTSFALLALRGVAGGVSTNSIQQIVDWLLVRLERLGPGVHVERRTTVEEYDVPYRYGGREQVFQNSLPHFAAPVAVTAALAAGADPLQPRVFAAVQGIIDKQIRSGACSGAWDLPRSPTRPSIWAIWPFLAALHRARIAVFPSRHAQATLLYSGCAIIQPAGPRKMTLGLILKNSFVDSLRRNRVAVALATVALLAAGVSVVLLALGEIDLTGFFTAMVLPALLLVFQLLWGIRSRVRRGSS